VYPRVLWEYLSLDIPSKNLLGADNQQERLFLAGWIVGMTDGEGCFSISIFKNVTTRLGWQVMPEFVVTQSAKSYQSLQTFKDYFQCGRIFINRRYDSHHEQLYRFCVRNRQDLEQKIVPFFRQYSLQTAKRLDFEKFCKVLLMMKDKNIFRNQGLMKLDKSSNKRWKKNPQRLYVGLLKLAREKRRYSPIPMAT